MSRFLLVMVAALSATACSEAPTQLPDGVPSLSIEDALHNDGNEHFFWLPPMVSSPTYTGSFDGALSPVVEICEWTGSACVTPPLAEFTTTTGPGSETIRVVPEEEQYIVNWHTDEFGLDPAKTYRIMARVDGQELGHADVDVVSNGSQLKNVDTDEYIPLKDGRTLPIKFRIEDGALITGLWASVGLGDEFSCALTTDGDGYCWGRQFHGQGGTGQANRLNLFIQPILGGRTFGSIHAGSRSHCALSGDGSTWCSGYNAWGVLGTSVIQPTPCGVECVYEQVPVEGGPFTEIGLRETHGCGLTSAGAAHCWGTANAQSLGNGSDGSLSACASGASPANCSRTPYPVAGSQAFASLTVGAVSCGLTAPGDPLGNVWCWGENKWGSVGDGTFNNRYYTPVRGGGGMTFAQIDGGMDNTCALTDTGEAWCWGYNTYGTLGNGDVSQPEVCWASSGTVCAKSPVQVAAPAGVSFTQISVGDGFGAYHACAIADSGDAYCWGRNDYGQVGDGVSTTDHAAPTPVAGGHRFIDIEAGRYHTCGVTTGRDLYCWGRNEYAQLGAGVLPGDPDTSLGDANPHPAPVKILDPA